MPYKFIMLNYHSFYKTSTKCCPTKLSSSRDSCHYRETIVTITELAAINMRQMLQSWDSCHHHMATATIIRGSCYHNKTAATIIRKLPLSWDYCHHHVKAAFITVRGSCYNHETAVQIIRQLLPSWDSWHLMRQLLPSQAATRLFVAS